MPAVSVLLPCYNAQITLLEALRSLSSQSMHNFEIVAVDDGSTDATPQILAAFAAGDERLRVIRQPHAGIIPALTAGLASCRSEIIARMDADDRCHPQRLARQLTFLQDHPDIAIVGCRVNAYPPGQVAQGFQIYLEWQNSLLTDGDIRREMFVESPLAHPSVMIRRAWLENSGGYQEHGWAEDYDLWLRLYLAGAHFAKLPEALLDWREHPERLTRRDPRYSLENFLRAKAHYLVRGPLANRQAVFIWGAGMTGRRLSKHLLRQEARLVAFLDIDPHKIGRLRRGLPVLSAEELPVHWSQSPNPALLVAVGARGARPLIRERLAEFGLAEGQEWWFAA